MSNHLKAIPPNSEDIELSILSSCFTAGEEVLLDIIGLVEPEYFYSKANQILMNEIKDLNYKHITIDSIVVAESLKDKGLLDGIGGILYISRILDYPTAVDHEQYCRKLEEKFLLRKTIERCNAIIKRAYLNQDEFDSVVEYFLESAYSVSDGSKARDPVKSIGEVCLDQTDTYDKRYKNKNLITGIESGIVSLDIMTSGFQPGDLTFIAARPAMGKTALALNIMRHNALKGVGSLMFSLEMPNAQLLDRNLAMETRIKGQNIRIGKFTPEEFDLIQSGLATIHDFPIYIDDRGGLSFEEIVKISRRQIKRNPNIKFIIIDHVQLIRGKYYDQRNLDLGLISAGFKTLAKELRIPVIALAQLNRELERRINPYKRPKLSDLRDSGSLEQDADNVVFLYRPWVYGDDLDPSNPKDRIEIHESDCELIVAKQRNGPTGTIKCLFFDSIQKFENRAEVSPNQLYKNGGVD